MMRELLARKPNRLHGYDYSQNGMYFVTICTQNRAEIFGHIVGDGLAHPELAHPELAHPELAHPATDNVRVQLSEYGIIAETELCNIPTHYPGIVMLDCFVVMPNHIHAIIHIMHNQPVGDGLAHPAADSTHPAADSTHPVDMRAGQARAGQADAAAGRASPSPTLGNIVGGYKSGVSRLCGFAVWQRSYHDHIIRDEADYQRIAAYIENNPAQWQADRFFVGDG